MKESYTKFIKDLHSNKVPVTMTGEELNIIIDKIGKKKNVSISFGVENHKEIVAHMKNKGILFSKIISDFLHLDNISNMKEYR